MTGKNDPANTAAIARGIGVDIDNLVAEPIQYSAPCCYKIMRIWERAGVVARRESPI